MQPIVQSLFFKALTFALAGSIWQMALVWFIVILILRVFKLPASQKFNIAFTGQLTGFVLFICSLVYYYKNINTSFIIKVTYADQLHNYISASTTYISIIYVIILMYQFSRLFFSYNITQRLRKCNLKKMPAANRIFVQQITALLSLKKNVSIYLSSAVRCPLTIGFFKPVILVPLAAINHLTKEQMEAVLLHEMAHIKRYDYLINLVQLFIEKIFFFNIFSMMIHDIIEHERENACDDFVLQFKYNAFHYAEALFKLGRLQTTGSFAMAASGKKENVLLLRIKRLINQSDQSFSYNFKSSIYCLLILISALSVSISNSNYSSHQTDFTVKNTYTKNINKPVLIIKLVTAANSQTKVSSNSRNEKSIGKQLFKNQNDKPQKNIITGDTKSEAYLVNTSNSIDSIKQTAYTNAVNKKIVLNSDIYNKALSYQNFKQLESMLYASGKSITITEDPASKDSYKKLITIEATDAQGNKNIYKVIVELYQ